MTTFVLVPGAGGNASYWRELVAELESRRHEALPVDIAQDDPALGLPEYADLVADVIGPRSDAVLVAQSLGGFTAPMVAARRPVRMIVLVNAMIPLPGESPGEWGDATGADAAREDADEAAGRDLEIDLERHFLHDLPGDVRAQMEQDPPPRGVADTIWGQPCDIEHWPDVTTHVIAGRDDRFFPLPFQQRVARDRLGLEADVLPGGHLLAKSRAPELADRLEQYVASR